jgi:hypothetical protein
MIARRVMSEIGTNRSYPAPGHRRDVAELVEGAAQAVADPFTMQIREPAFRVTLLLS